MSGSCVSLNKIYKLLKDENIDINIISSKGNLFNTDVTIYNSNFNIFKIFMNIFILWKNINSKDSFVILNTILLLPYYFILRSKHKILYIHEQNLNPKLLYKLVVSIINIFNVRVAVVNPKMLCIYKNSFLLPNIIDLDIVKLDKKYPNQVLMIANCNFNKGIDTFIKIALNNPLYNFVLLTNKTLAKKECLLYLKDINLKNLELTFSQNKKEKLLRESNYLLSLSFYNETFGLVLSEAITYNTIPISIINDGSNYCLKSNDFILFNRTELINNFQEIIHNISDNRDSILKELKEFHDTEFSPEMFLNRLKKEINDNKN